MWRPEFVVVSFAVVFTFGCYFTFLAAYNVYRFEMIYKYKHNVMYSIFGYHISALGCLWYKLWLSRVTISHAAVHTVSLGFYYYGISKEISDDKFFLDRNYGAAFCGLLLIVQYISGIIVNIVPFNSVRVRSLLFGLHAYGGAWTFIISSYYNSLVYCFIRDENEKYKYFLRLLKGHEYALFFMICASYLLLNPCYDWRRMKSFSIVRAEPEKVKPAVS